MSRRRVETTIALLFTAVTLVAGGGALAFFLTISPVHTDPAAVPSATAGTPDRRYAAAIADARRSVRALLVGENLPGLSLAVAREGEIVWAEGFGWADIDRHTPVTPDTRFRLGSVSKTVTAAGAAVLHDQGRLDLDAPVQRYVPAYPQKPWPVTTRQLMGDIAGVHRIRGDNNDLLPGRHCTNLQEALAIVADEPLLFRPGTQYRFAFYGWLLVTAAVEGAAMQPFATFMAREVFAPLRMTRTALEGTDELRDTTSFYGPRVMLNTALGLDAATGADYSCYFGAGAFLSTPSDLVRLGSAMIKPGLLRAETLATFTSPLRLESGESTGFALGWRVEEALLAGASRRILIHRATPVGGTVTLMLVPELGLVVAAVSNASQARGMAPLGLTVAAAFAQGATPVTVRHRDCEPGTPC